MSLRKVMLFALFVVLTSVAAFVFVILWSGRDILENSRAANAQDTEWLTVENDRFEFRGNVYQTSEALLVALRQVQPKPELVSIRWVVAGGTTSPNQIPSTQVKQARDALLKANIASPGAVIGNEVFVVESPAASRAR